MKKKRTLPLILVNEGEKAKLCELFSCSYPTVRTALKGKVTTVLHVKIRTAAIERGGVEYVINK